MRARSPLRQKITNFFRNQAFRQNIPEIVSVIILIIIFSIYGYSIYHDRFPLGNGDHGSRFLIAVEYARDPSKILSLESWLGVWPPVPLIIQGFILRLVSFPGISDSIAGIRAIQLTSVFLVLLGFLFIGRSVALQTDKPTGVFVYLLCFCASITLYLANTSGSEVYAFFFISLALWQLLRFIKQNRGLAWSIVSFALAFFCRSESLIVAMVAGAFLLAYRQWRPAALLIGITIALAVSKLMAAIFLVEGIKFFEYGQLHDFGNTWHSRFNNALLLVEQLLHYNKEFIILSGICLIPLIYHTINASKHGKFLNSSLVRAPVVFWAVFFFVSMGVLIGEALRGNINAQWRYLATVNVFMTTTIALLLAQTVRILQAKNARIAKQISLGIISLLVLFSLWSGFSHATGRTVEYKMSPSVVDVIQFIRKHKVQGDRVAYDFLSFQENIMAAYLLDSSITTPTQFAITDSDREFISSLFPKPLQNQLSFRTLDLTIARLHAFIHTKHPKFLMLASDRYYESLQKKKIGTVDRSHAYIRQYLSPFKSRESDFVFQSPYILPEIKIPFRKIYENKNYIVLKRLEK